MGGCGKPGEGRLGCFGVGEVFLVWTFLVLPPRLCPSPPSDPPPAGRATFCLHSGENTELYRYHSTFVCIIQKSSRVYLQVCTELHGMTMTGAHGWQGDDAVSLPPWVG